MTSHDLFPLAEIDNLRTATLAMRCMREIFLTATDAEELGTLVSMALGAFEEEGLPMDVAIAMVTVVLGCLGFDPPA